MSQHAPKSKKPIAPEDIPLTPKHAAFVAAYLANGMHGTKAAITAGYNQTPYALAVTASRLLKRANISKAIKEAIKRAKMDADEVLARISEVARASVDDFLDNDGDVSREALRQKGHLVKHRRRRKVVTTDKDGNKVETIQDDIELNPQLDALRDMGKVHRLFSDKTPAEDKQTYEFVVKVEGGNDL